jgi:hypothetical protein
MQGLDLVFGSFQWPDGDRELLPDEDSYYGFSRYIFRIAMSFIEERSALAAGSRERGLPTSDFIRSLVRFHPRIYNV